MRTGILTQAQKAKEETEKATENEKNILNSYENYINGMNVEQWNEEKGVNSPQIVEGMTEISFKLPDEENNIKGEVIKKEEEGFDENNWYDYKESKWANTMTEDGSMWVWIPRFAYKITYKTENKSDGGTIDVKFLIGTTDKYYDENGKLQEAKRVESATEIVDTTSNYYVHPAFTDESDINFANGGWDEELTGIWVAKFEAGYASGNNDTNVVASMVNYSQSDAMVEAVESETGTSSRQKARNWLDGLYGEQTTSIKYPTFRPMTYSMNYINANDAYNISKNLTGINNIYGFNSSSTDSHLMKNSEWGAVAYLSWSQYGTNGTEPYINNITANSGDEKRGTEINENGQTGLISVYAITGLTTGTVDAEVVKITEDNLTDIETRIGDSKTNGISAWDQATGQKSSSTLNMYGVYDLSGGLWERTSSYINNEDNNLNSFGASIVSNGNISTKYSTVYPYKSPESTENKQAGINNYNENNYIIGDAIRETSTAGSEYSSWNGDYSYYNARYDPFSVRGGDFTNNSYAGEFYFHRTSGDSTTAGGFRPVLVAL